MHNIVRLRAVPFVCCWAGANAVLVDEYKEASRPLVPHLHMRRGAYSASVIPLFVRL